MVGEAFGSQENIVKQPFIGQSGQELTRMISDAGFSRKDCFLTNVFPFHPPANNLELICTSKKELPKGYPMPMLKQGKYVKPEYLHHVERLKTELEIVRPNIIIALGNTACWALLQNPKITTIRGTVGTSTLIPGAKTIATYHPAGVMREWSWRVIVICDLQKALRESEYPEIRRPKRTVITEPTLDELRTWASKPTAIYSVDIETAANQVTCIGFARSIDDAIVVKFADQTKPGWSFWADPKDEAKAWGIVREMLHSRVPKLFQNGIFDLTFLYKLGFRPCNCIEDTMLLSHAIWPEMKKGLGFLGSIHTSEPAWKLLAIKHMKEPDKKDG